MYESKKVALTFFVGGATYGLIEIVARGYTHWTMIITGGVCFSLFYIITSKMKKKSIFLRCLIACGIITFFEFLVGYIANIRFNLGVWNYSNLPFNFMGQICLQYSLIWFLMGLPMTYVVNNMNKISVKIGGNSYKIVSKK